MLKNLPNLQDHRKFPGMVGWFNPGVLAKTGRKALESALFGQYADRRLIHAALDPETPAALAKRYDLRQQISSGADGAIWIDYVADLGDGFDSTYAIAYLLGQKSITIEGAGTLPRGQMLIMGGDQVYPDASRDEYRRRLRTPYGFAFPDSKKPDSDHPPVFVIPGNHDWYDGLTQFLAVFCRGRETPLGSWRASQHRSYFALQLPGNWWIWAYDSQLAEDIDQPQAAYFVHVARAMHGHPKVILCAPTPTWLKADISAKDKAERDEFYRALHYVAYDILKSKCPDARVIAVLSGDQHHYSRYSAEIAGTQFITAGGGGAFLHPTHHLKDTIKASWVRKTQTFSLLTEPDARHETVDQEACYPDRKTSRSLVLGNWKFPWVNPRFCLVLGGIYWLVAQLLMLGQGDVFDQTQLSGMAWAYEIALTTLARPMYLILVVALVAALWVYSDAKSKWGRLGLAVAHGVGHLALILLLVSVLPPLNATLFAWTGLENWLPSFTVPGTDLPFLIFLVEMVLIGGFAGGVVWGLYLLLVSYFGARHYNDAFSAMRLDSYRHFLRLRIKGDELTIYPIGLDEAPRREDWKLNEQHAEGNQSEPRVVPKEPLRPHLIEGPVVIRARHIKYMTEVATMTD